MPLYEYHCLNCNRTYEELQGAKAPKTIDCPECGTLAERVLSTPARPLRSGASNNNPTNTGYSPGCPLCEYRAEIVTAACIVHAIKNARRQALRDIASNN